GNAINFDGPHSKEVRTFFIANAGYWIDEFHFDGLRLDATEAIYDQSTPHIIAEISQQVRKMAPHKQTYVTAENEQQLTEFLFPVEKGGCGLDGLWNDDFHHTARVRLTGCREGYYIDYLGSPQEFLSALKHGYLYQGQWHLWKEKNRGTPSLEVDPS